METPSDWLATKLASVPKEPNIPDREADIIHHGDDDNDAFEIDYVGENDDELDYDNE